VERSFSRLKGQRFLNHIAVRRLRQVTAHCYLSLIAMQASKATSQELPVAVPMPALHATMLRPIPAV
jgi:hypothetical protein